MTNGEEASLFGTWVYNEAKERVAKGDDAEIDDWSLICARTLLPMAEYHHANGLYEDHLDPVWSILCVIAALDSSTLEVLAKVKEDNEKLFEGREYICTEMTQEEFEAKFVAPLLKLNVAYITN